MMSKTIKKLRIRVPGSTSNLGSGFDTVGLALQMYLTLDVSEADSLRIELFGEGADELPVDDSNLLIRAYLAASDRFKLPPKKFDLRIHNEIPLKRGLGSSGAAIAAGLFLAQHQADNTLSVREVLEVGCEIEGHPDNLVASFLGGFCVNCYSGGRLTYKRIAPASPPKAIVLIPDFTISTAAARKLLPESIPFNDVIANIQRAGLLAIAFSTGDYDLLKEAVKDRVHQPFRNKLIPGYDAIVEAAYTSGALAVCISGSGSTVLAFTKHDSESTRKAMFQAVESQSYQAHTRIVEIDQTGATILG